MSFKRPSADDSSAPIDAPQTSSKRARTMADRSDKMDIDENLHSRQLAVYGREAFRRFAKASVLISGLNALGVEVGAQPRRSGRAREGN